MAEKTIDEADLIKRAIENHKIAWEYLEDAYAEMIEDLAFGNGDQWPDKIKAEREAEDRPCLRINKIPQFTDRVMGEMRQARPMIKVRPVDDKGDADTADIIGGVIRNIEQQSDAEIVYDTGGEAMVRCGYGAWRVLTDYAGEDTFDQEIKLARIKNQFSIVWDPAATNWDRSDGRFLLIVEDMPRETFKQKYKDKDPCNFDSSVKAYGDWVSEKTVRVAEYFEREQKPKTIYLLLVEGENKPKTAEELPTDKAYSILKERKVVSTEINWYRITAKEILEGPVKVAGKYIPVVPCLGKETTIEGKSYYSGVIRHAKDSQRLYNYYRSYDAETIALAPKAPWIMTADMIGPFKNQWAQANKRNYSYLLYVPDAKAPGAKPERNVPALASQAIMQNVMIADQELHDTIGLQLASLGKKSNEQSGRAVEARAQEGSVGQFTYVDNLSRAIKYTAKIIIAMIPEIYDTGRVMRIIGEDGAVNTVEINKETEFKGKQAMFDLSTGKYDVVASVGPSYQTQRQESVAAMIDFAKMLDPPQRAVIADQIASSADWHGAEKIAKRLKKMLPEGVADPEEAEQQEPPAPPTDAQMKQQAMMEAQAEAAMETMEVELAIKKAELKKTEAEAAKAEAEAAISEADATDRANGYTRPEPKKAAK